MKGIDNILFHRPDLMCTTTWIRQPDGFRLLFNRDERKSRSQALPPSVHTLDKVKVLMPIDPEGGGSWISLNEWGLGLCLHNQYTAAINREKRHWESRGQVVKKLSSSQTITELNRRIQAISLSRFRGFQVLALSKNDPRQQVIQSWVWDGHQLVGSRQQQPIFSSSSFNTEAVAAARMQTFETYINRQSFSVDSLRALHRLQDLKEGWKGVSMERDDAKTVSFTEIGVNGSHISIHYLNEKPTAESPAPIILQLPLKAY